MKPQLTPEQLAALRAFATANGRRWKDALRHCWYSGAYARYSGTEDSASLQQIRNTFGPTWLVRFSFQPRARHVRTQDAATATGMYDHDDYC